MVIKLGFAAHISVNFGGQPDPEKWTLSTMDSKHDASLTTFFEVDKSFIVFTMLYTRWRSGGIKCNVKRQ